MAAELQKTISEEHDILQRDETLREIVRRLADVYQPERIYLFGSRARGDHRPNSDYDLLVIVSDDAPPERRQDQFSYKHLQDLEAWASVLVYTNSHFEARRHLKASLPGIVLREGKLLYGREGCPIMADGSARMDDTKTWLAKAENDLKSADHLFGASPPLLGTAVFCCQQAAEKTLKGFLAWHDVPFAKTHDIEELGVACIALDANLNDTVRRASSLTDYAWKFRYPGRAGDPLEPSLEQTKDAIEIAHELFDVVVSRLPEECKP
jgi:predicted nucleotidyltransferase/HEPN domain-containing protein